MIDIVLRDPQTDKPLWLDVVEPKEDELHRLAAEYGLHAELVADCMEPFHLPKLEKSGAGTFLLIRAYDERADPDTTSVQGLTRKLAFFIGDRFLITVHSQPQAYISEIKEEYRARARDAAVYLQVILLELVLGAIDTYQNSIERAELEIEGFEARLFAQARRRWTAEEVYKTKTQLLAIKRMLWHGFHAIQKFIPHTDSNLPLWQEVKERTESQLFFVDSLLDDIDNLLNVQISLASQSASEIMRVLTVFSAFFMPLTFIVGVYGMNFRFMPELEWRYGYIFAWGAILATVAAIFFWFRKKGWMR